MAREDILLISRQAGESLRKIEEVSKAVQKSFSDTAKQSGRTIEEQKKALAENKAIIKKYKEVKAEELGVVREFIAQEEGAGIKIKDFGDTLTEVAAKIPVFGETIAKARKDPTSFAFEQQVPILGLKAKLVSEVGKAVEDVIKGAFEDSAQLMRSTISLAGKELGQAFNQEVREGQRRISGRENIAEEIISSLGPAGAFASKGQFLALYNAKKQFVDLEARGYSKGRAALDPALREDANRIALEAAWNSPLAYLLYPTQHIINKFNDGTANLASMFRGS